MMEKEHLCDSKKAKTDLVTKRNENPYMKTKKALGGLFGLLGSLAAFLDCFLPAPAPFRFNLNDASQNENANVKH